MQKPKKSLSQNFLIDKNIANKIISKISITNKNIIEIGPGYGALTNLIIKKNPKKLVLIEKDKKLYNYLNIKYKDYKNIFIFNADALNYDFSKQKNLKIISNLPYNISSKILLKLLKLQSNITEILVMIQKEMSLKFDYNRIKLNKYKFFTKLTCEYERIFDVPATVFIPKPKVKSTIVKIKLKNNEVDWHKAELFAKFIFKNKRKKIANNIKMKNFFNSNMLEKRIEQINVDELLKIYNSF